MHKIVKVKNFSIEAPYTLRLHFDDESQQTINFFPILQGEMYGPLRDAVIFNQVHLDKEVGTIVWPNGADFDPAMLHNWKDYEHELLQRSQQWTLIKN